MSFLNQSRSFVIKYWEKHPLRSIMILAIITRLIAVIFAKGFGWFDDHFLIIEASQSWVDGYDYNRWLPGSEGNQGPGGHNMFYAGLHYILFRFLEWLNLTDPQGKMFVVRFLHAALSLLVIYFGYKIADLYGNAKATRLTGLLLAILWLFPFLSVRNLIEYTCVPFLLWGTWILLRPKISSDSIKWGLVAGLILGLAFSMRFQSLIYIGGIGLGLLLLGKWKEAISAGAGVLITAFLCLGTIDIFLWGYPFAELIEYVNYNMHHYGEYIIGPWYQYLLVILGILIPPLSIFLFYGTFYAFYKRWKDTLLIFLPVIIFLVFHSYFPNKQERFILPIIPSIIILGTVGWNWFIEQSVFWKNRKRLIKGSMTFVWIINLVLLMVISTTYSKRSRVESMTYLSKYDNISMILVENTNQYNTNLLTRYYLGQWPDYIEISKSATIEKLSPQLIQNRNAHPDFYIFEGNKNIEKRVEALKELFPDMTYETSISPGFIDRILHWLNPINENQNAYIYRNAHLHQKK